MGFRAGSKGTSPIREVYLGFLGLEHPSGVGRGLVVSDRMPRREYMETRGFCPNLCSGWVFVLRYPSDLLLLPSFLPSFLPPLPSPPLPPYWVPLLTSFTCSCCPSLTPIPFSPRSSIAHSSLPRSRVVRCTKWSGFNGQKSVVGVHIAL